MHDEASAVVGTCPLVGTCGPGTRRSVGPPSTANGPVGLVSMVALDAPSRRRTCPASTCTGRLASGRAAPVCGTSHSVHAALEAEQAYGIVSGRASRVRVRLGTPSSVASSVVCRTSTVAPMPRSGGPASDAAPSTSNGVVASRKVAAGARPAWRTAALPVPSSFRGS